MSSTKFQDMNQNMTKERSFFQRFLAYTLCYVIFLQQPLVIAADLVSLERAEAITLKIPLSRSKKKADAPSYKTATGYSQLLDVPDKTLRLALSPDLEKLDSLLILFKSSDRSKVACLHKTKHGLALQILEGYALTLVSQEHPLPNLFVESVGRISLDAEKVINPLTLHASSIKFLKDMKVHSPVVLWAKGEVGPRGEDDPEPITLTIQNSMGAQVPLEARGRVQTKGLKGNGTLSIFAGEFRNNASYLLHQIQIRAHIENGLQGDLCGRDTVFLEGTLKNRGFIRTRGDLVESIMYGGLFEHTDTSRTFSLNSHRVEGTSYLHNGKVYSAGAMRVLASVMTFGPKFHFMGNRFIGNARHSIEAPNPSTLFEALRYIELKSTDDLDNRARLRVHNFPFPFDAYFGDLSGLDEEQRLQYQKKSKELAKEQKYVISDDQGEAGYGILFSSSKGTIFQAGDIYTSGNDILLKASHVGHDGITRSGTVGPGSVKVVAQSANLRGRIEASRRVEAHVTGGLTMDLFLKSPLTLVFANSLDLSGNLNTSLIAKVAGSVRFLDQLKAQAISVDATSLSVLQTPGSTAGPQEIGSLQASVSTFLIQKPLILSGPSWAHVESWFVNQSHLTVNGFFEATMRGGHYLGSMDGSGTLSLKAPAFRDVVDLAFGKTRVQTKTIHVTAEEQDVVIDESHTTDRQVSLRARSLAIKADQTVTGGLSLGSTNGDVTMQGITLDTADQLLSLEAIGGDFYAQGARTRSGILSIRSSGHGFFGGGIFSTPQMYVSIAGVCDTSTTTRDILVPVTRYDENWGDYFTTHETQKQHVPASFLSKGTTRDGGRAYQYFDVGTYRGQGSRGQKAYYAADGSYHVDQETQQRVVHHSDGSLTILSHSTLDLAQADLRAGLSDTILLQSQFDMNLRNIHATGGRAQVVSLYGDILEHVDVLTNVTHVNRSGCGGDYTYQTTSQHQAQRAEGNFWNMFAGRQTRADGTELPTLLFQVARGKSIISQASTLNVPNGLVMRTAPDGTIQQTTVTLSDTFSQHHETRGKGYNNHFYEGWSNVRGIGGSVSATAEVANCFRLEETGYDRRIRDYYLEYAQEVIRRAAMSHYSAYSMANLSKDGADMFSSSGSAHHSQTMNARYATRVLFDVGHYIENQPGTTTWEGPIHAVMKASTLRRNQLYKAIQQTMEQTTTSSVDNMSSFQPSRFSLPRFTSSSNPIDMLKGATQVLGHANQAMKFLNNLKSGNGLGLAHQLLSQFTNFSSTSSEQYMRQFEMTEAAPFIKQGRTFIKAPISITGTVAGHESVSPEGEVPLFDVRAPRHERTMEAWSSQSTTNVNPLTLSVGQNNSRSRQSSSSTGSLPSSVSIFGHPNLRINKFVGDGVGLSTFSGGDQDFTQRTCRLLIDGRVVEVPYLVVADASSGESVIARPTAERVSLGEAVFKAARYSQESHQEFESSSWGFNGLEIALTLYGGGVPDPWMIANAFSVGFGGEERHSSSSGTHRLNINALGAPIVIDGNQHTEGDVVVGSGVTANTYTHTHIENRSSSSHEVDRGGQMLEAVFAVRDAYNAVKSFKHNVDELFKPKPILVDYGQNSRVLNEWIDIRDQADRGDSEAKTVSRAHQSGRGNPSDRDPDGRTRRGHHRTRLASEVARHLDQVADESSSARDFVGQASQAARRGSSQPIDESGYDTDEGEKETRVGKVSHGIKGGIKAAAKFIGLDDLMRKVSHKMQLTPEQQARMNQQWEGVSGHPDVGYSPQECAGGPGTFVDIFLRRTGLTDKYQARAMGNAVNDLFVLSGSAAAAKALGKVAISGISKSIGSVARSGKTWTHFPTAEMPNPCANVANRNAFNPAILGKSSANTSSMEALIGRRISQPIANHNIVPVFDIRATGTGGPSFMTRMSQGGRSDIPGGFSAGHTEGLGVSSAGTRAVQSSGGSSGQSQTPFIRRIDKQQAHAERMVRGDGNPLEQKLDFSRDSKRTKGDAAHHIQTEHSQLRLDKPDQTVFYGEPTHVVQDAWGIARQKNIKPINCGYEDVYVVPRSNSGYVGGPGGQRTNLDYILIRVEAGTNKLITAHPSGAAPPFPKKYIPFSVVD